MTTPQPEGLYFPPWYKGGSPDAELLMQLLFQPMLGQTENTDGSWTPTYVVTYLPNPDVYDPWLNAGYAYLRAYRMGGPYNYEQKRDEPRIALAALTRSRDTSWYLLEFARRVLLAYENGGTVDGATGVEMWFAGEVVGPQQIPELIQDDRLVQITVGLHTKLSGIPNYKQFV